jgi:hypothetical protein
VKPEEIFDEREIILTTMNEDTHFHIKRWKYYSYNDKQRQRPIQKNSVEMQRSCEGAGVKNAFGQDDIIGWTTADEELIPPYNHRIARGIRAYHRLDLSKLEYEFHYLGWMSLWGEFRNANEYPYGETIESNIKTSKLKIVDENWETFFHRVRDYVC